MHRSLLIAFVLALTAGGTLAAEAPFRRQAILDAAGQGLIWCADYQAKAGDCDHVAMLRVEGDRLRQAGLLRLFRQPDVQVAFTSPAVLEGDALCSDMSFKVDEVLVLVAGKPAPPMAAAPFLAMLAALSAEFEGKRGCETYMRDEATGLVRSTVTVDGQTRDDLADTYRLLPAGGAYVLRPAITPEDMQEEKPV